LPGHQATILAIYVHLLICSCLQQILSSVLLAFSCTPECIGCLLLARCTLLWNQQLQ
jgi:hypothetical protein